MWQKMVSEIVKPIVKVASGFGKINVFSIHFELAFAFAPLLMSMTV